MTLQIKTDIINSVTQYAINDILNATNYSPHDG